MLDELVARAKADPAFADIHRKFASAGIENWLSENEKALHFAVGAFAPGGGAIVEIGSFQGGSACFLAAGVARRGAGRLVCVDPHLGVPIWLASAPHQRTLEIFRTKTRECGVADQIDVKVGESSAVAAVWPAEPIDAVFIDGDHSFLDALKDLECWGTKVRAEGLVMIDDADDSSLPEVLELIEFAKTLRSVRYLGIVDGIAVFQRTELSPWEMLQELSAKTGARRIHRPWDLEVFQGQPLPPEYLNSKDWSEGHLDEVYQICFLARCGPGLYGYTASSRPPDRAILRAVSKDRNDGEIREVGGIADTVRAWLRQPRGNFRAILCASEDARACVRLLLPGGVLMVRLPVRNEPAVLAASKKSFIALGMQGTGVLNGEFLFGIWKPHHLSFDAIVEAAVANAA